jgi:FAD/FMN-containing dehydrogenase
MATRDYLWRWDPDWFWCSKAFGMDDPILRFLFGRWMLRSSAYWKILTNYRKWRIEAKMRRLRKFLGIPISLREPVIQDLEIPFGHCSEFLDFYHRHIDIRPCWVCPVVPRSSERPWPLYPMEPGAMHLNFGFWESVPTREDLPPDHFNRLLEKETTRLGGRKSLYSSVHYPEDEFWQIHDRAEYERLKGAYDPSGRFLDLWTKVVRGR